MQHLKCILCGADDYSVVKEFADGVTVARCRACNLLYTPLAHDAPSTLLTGNSYEELKLYYQPILSGQKRHFRHKTFGHYLDLIQKHRPSGTFLDVGCAHGFFLKEANKRGYLTMGIEPSASMAHFGRTDLGLEILDGKLSDVDLGSRVWDVITVTDALEYFPNPVETLQTLRDHLAPGGVLFVKVPNGEYFSWRHPLERRFLSRERWANGAAFGPTMRVGHYSISTLRQLFERAGLSPIKGGSWAPIDSPIWPQVTGLWLEMEEPWYQGLSGKIARRALHAAGKAQERAGKTNSLSQSVYCLGSIN